MDVATEARGTVSPHLSRFMVGAGGLPYLA
jgi:hypothetical protein